MILSRAGCFSANKSCLSFILIAILQTVAQCLLAVSQHCLAALQQLLKTETQYDYFSVLGQFGSVVTADPGPGSELLSGSRINKQLQTSVQISSVCCHCVFNVVLVSVTLYREPNFMTNLKTFGFVDVSYLLSKSYEVLVHSQYRPPLYHNLTHRIQYHLAFR